MKKFTKKDRQLWEKFPGRARNDLARIKNVRRRRIGGGRRIVQQNGDYFGQDFQFDHFEMQDDQLEAQFAADNLLPNQHAEVRLRFDLDDFQYGYSEISNTRP